MEVEVVDVVSILNYLWSRLAYEIFGKSMGLSEMLSYVVVETQNRLRT